MRTLIVSRTHIKGGACVGAITTETLRSLRLLPPEGLDPREWPHFQVGQLWELAFTPVEDAIPPHLEDVVLSGALFLGEVEDLPAYLTDTLRILPWTGAPDKLFGGLLRFTATGRGYISHATGVPLASTGFWISDRELFLTFEGTRPHYTYQSGWGTFTLPYVGFEAPLSFLPAGTLLRVSLARWWKPDDRPEAEERCYLQLSGWYE